MVREENVGGREEERKGGRLSQREGGREREIGERKRGER